jgi:predicted component of type VI protein secretion system
MSDEHLQDALQDLHAEAERAGSIDEDTRQLLRTVMEDIQSLLDRTDRPAVPQEHHSLAERLKAMTWHLEETHPALTSVMGRMIDMLGRTIP